MDIKHKVPRYYISNVASVCGVICKEFYKLCMKENNF